MTDQEMLAKVKDGLGLTDANLNATIQIKMLAVKQYMINAGVADVEMESDLGIAILTIGVNDIWNLSPGEVKFSPAFISLVDSLRR